MLKHRCGVVQVAAFTRPLVQQPRLGGGAGVVASLDELYEVAEVGRLELKAALEALAARHPGAYLKLAPLKARERALEKAQGG
jgi:hypothetical protein